MRDHPLPYSDDCRLRRPPADFQGRLEDIRREMTDIKLRSGVTHPAWDLLVVADLAVERAKLALGVQKPSGSEQPQQEASAQPMAAE